MAFAIGENVGPYRIVEQLGQGGMASVFKAYHAALDRYVAIKALHPAFKGDPTFLARFQREAKVIARLEHRNIVPIYDFSEHEGRPYLVMKFIEGETLKARLLRGPLGREEARRIVKAVGEGLSYAHAMGILHRDIKPSNILLGEDSSIYLADFGLARIAEAGESTISSEMMLGTPQYISPEQARGEKNLTEGTDIYSLGVVLYEILVGKVPFSADTPFSIIHDHIYTPLPLPREINPNVPESMQRVLLKALAKDRSGRFETVQDLVDSFQTAIEGGAVDLEVDLPPEEATAEEAVPSMEETPERARQPAKAAGSPPEREPEPERPRRRRRWWLVAGALVTVCICVFGFAAVAGLLEEREGPDQGGPITEITPGGDADRPTPVAERPPSRPLLAARATVAANPDDPEAHLLLAQTLFQEELPRLALQEALLAAELFMGRGDPVSAADVLSKGLIVSGGPEVADRALVELLREALFFSAGTPDESMPIVEELFAEFPEWPYVAVAAARTRLHSGAAEEAFEILESRLGPEPEDPVARAVRAEILLELGLVDESQALLVSILDQPGTPPWLVGHIESLLEMIAGG